ncbi:MAG: HD domain-containing protein [Candidatus Liptonbacteria bacterium]|nr:HD domain-containing protein [Candidatus Liptonbacteria bacterium]
MNPEIPKEVQEVAKTLTGAGFEAHLVGGCVRDLVLGREPKDWDIATNATPKEMLAIFEDSVYENNFGTVGVKTRSENPKLAVVEVTTYRVEGKYTDKRHPDEVKFAKTIEEDLSRRDFTINAMAVALQRADSKEQIVDPFEGREDLKKKVIRTVGKPEERFNEDALRLMRAIRFATELGGSSAGRASPEALPAARGGPVSGWHIDPATRKAVAAQAELLAMIAKERIRDEFVKIIEAPQAAKGVLLLEDTGLLKHIMLELREGIGVSQNKHHIYEVFEHHVRSLDYTAKQGYQLHVRLAALLHDLGKPKTKGGEGLDATFYGHEMVGARMAVKALERLKFSKDIIEQVAHLVRYHMFYYNVGEVSPAGVRRFLARVGPETVPDLIRLREADRIGSGVPKAVPYKLRHFLFMIEKVKRDPVSPKMVVVKGDSVMRILGIPPGPRVGWILNILLEEVLEDPKRNTKEYLEGRVQELGALTDAKLKALAEGARHAKDEFEGGVEKDMKSKYHVT